MKCNDISSIIHENAEMISVYGHPGANCFSFAIRSPELTISSIRDYLRV